MINEIPTIVLVDDDPAVRGQVVRLLKRHGIGVEVFDSAQSFLQSSNFERTGCLVLDVSMPGMTGLELLKKINDEGTPLPIIFITGHGKIAQAVQAIRLGAIDYLEKPICEDMLIDSVKRAFSSGALQREAASVKRMAEHRFAALTPRERQVLRLLVLGAAKESNKTIARTLGISNRTVDHHRARIMEKTGAHSLADLVDLARQADGALLDPEIVDPNSSLGSTT